MENRISKIRQIKNKAHTQLKLLRYAECMRGKTKQDSLLNNVAQDVAETAYRELTLLIRVFQLELNLYKR